MNTSSLRTFAQNARNKLRAQVAARLNYWVGAAGGTPPDTAAHRQFAPQIRELRVQMAREGRDGLVERVSYLWFNRLAALRFMDANDFHPFGVHVVSPAGENNILPALLQQSRAGVMPAEIRAKLAYPQTFDDILAGRIPVAHPETELFGMLLLAACNYYHDIMPFLFEELGDATQLLLPEDLLSAQSILTDIRENLTADDCREVEVIGWLYQFYISERKDTVMGRKEAVPTEDIPAVTQLFTPHWIVRFLVENSLGRLWLLNRPHSRLREHMPYYIEGEPEADFLRINSPEEIKLLDPACGSAHMLTYAFDLLYHIYDEEAYDAKDIPSLILRHNLHGTEICERAAALAAFALCMKARAKDRRFFKRLTDGGEDAPKPRIIELLDVRYEENELDEYIAASGLNYYFKKTACDWVRDGSLLSRQSHFDAESTAVALLNLLEEKRLLMPRLESFELDPKVAKALIKHLKTGKKVSEMPARQLSTLREAAFLSMVRSREILDYPDELDLGDLAKQVHLKLFRQFEQAKNFGSLIQPCLTEAEIQSVRSQISDLESEIFGNDSDLMVAATHRAVLRVLDQAESLTQRYHIVVANPPYMGGKGMNGILKQFAKDNYANSKADLFTMFIERGFSLAMLNGYMAMITMQGWMFLATYEKLRNSIVSTKSILSMVHLGARAFDSISGEIVQSTAFVCANAASAKRLGDFFRIVNGNSESEKSALYLEALSDPKCKWLFQSCSDDFKKIPGRPIAYWATKRITSAFEDNPNVADKCEVKTGMSTTDNERFLRRWFEVEASSINFKAAGKEDVASSPCIWYPLNKGGGFRKWYGNLEFVVLWGNNGEAIRQYIAERPEKQVGGRLVNTEYFFRECYTWGEIASDLASFRKMDSGFVHGNKGPCIFQTPLNDSLLLFLNSNLATNLLRILNPTIGTSLGDIENLPLIELEPQLAKKYLATAIGLARADWDNFETSWDFRDLPLLQTGLKDTTLEESWRNWEAQSTAAIRRMQELETENNRLFIAAYGLQDEMKPDVPEEQITLARADRATDIAAFISYAVGCMMGRYSLDEPGLILANAGDTLEEFRAKVSAPSFLPDEDAILPVLDGEWFTDDIVGRFREFLRVTFGDASFSANLRFIEESLGSVDPKSGKIKPTDIRSYFVRDFYKNHLSNERAYGYKKRPIYWMVSSPNGSFQALIYLHRYARDTMNHVLDRYVRTFIDKLEQRQQTCTVISNDAAAKPADRTAAQKELIQLAKMLKEIREWERESLLPIAQQRIELDLDDGVKVNYLKFKGVLVPIPGLEKKEEE